MGRATKLTPEVGERIAKAIRAGNYFEAAARASGISPSTFYRWLELGAQDSEGIYRQFREQIKRAEAESEVHAVALIRKAMPGDWRAALALLERRHPERWRRRQTTELTGDAARGDQSRGAALDLSRLSDEELKTLEELISRASEQR
jgi:hypothetical protein